MDLSGLLRSCIFSGIFLHLYPSYIIKYSWINIKNQAKFFLTDTEIEIVFNLSDIKYS